MPNAVESRPASDPSQGRQLPLKALLRQGRYGAEHADGPGVQLSVRHPLSIATVIARKGKADSLSAELEGKFGIPLPAPRFMAAGPTLALQWCGAEQYFALSESFGEGELFRTLAKELDGLASVSDQSHGRVVIGISGRKARNVLAKGSPVDFHPRVFPLNGTAMTQMAHVGVHVSRNGDNAFEISLFRGFSENFWEWLTVQSEEFGFEIV
jgi:heterotetrameric sarcosine oxidase gamma subunit